MQDGEQKKNLFSNFLPFFYLWEGWPNQIDCSLCFDTLINTDRRRLAGAATNGIKSLLTTCNAQLFNSISIFTNCFFRVE